MTAEMADWQKEQELIKRWDSERELFNDDIAHTQAYFKIPEKRQTYFV